MRGLLAQLFGGHERTAKARKNTVLMFFLKGISILIGIVLVPLSINYVNKEQYGVWLTLSSIIAWASYFDIGLGNGMKNKVTEALARGDKKLARTYVSTTYAVIGVISLVLLILFLVINPLLNWSAILNADPALVNMLSSLAIILFANFCITFVLKLVSTLQLALQEPAYASSFDTITQVITLALVFILSKTTEGNLLYLGLATSVASIVTFLTISVILFKGKLKEFAPSLSCIEWKYSKDLVNLGMKFFIIQIAVLLGSQLNNIIITQVIGPSEVTVYNVAYKYLSVLLMVFTIIITPYWSAFTDAHSKGDWAWIKHTYTNLTRTFLLFVVGALVMVVVSPWVYDLWVGKEIEVTLLTTVLMALSIILTIWGTLHSFLLNGLGKLRIQFISAVCGGILLIAPLSILFCRWWGINGLIFAHILVSVLTSMWWSPLQVHLIINRKAKGIWNK